MDKRKSKTDVPRCNSDPEYIHAASHTFIAALEVSIISLGDYRVRQLQVYSPRILSVVLFSRECRGLRIHPVLMFR